MDSTRYTLFDTALGTCGIAWDERAITAIQLPEKDAEHTAARLQRTFAAHEGPPPAFVQDAIARLCAYLAGAQPDFDPIPLALDRTTEFRRRIYELARAIPPGARVTYGDLALRAGAPGGSRAVGQAMAQNPWPVVVPCHRVVAAGGKPGGFSAAGGLVTKARLLALEGAQLPGAEELPFDRDEAIRHLSAQDAKLGRLIREAGAFRLKIEAMQSPYEALARAIVYQQLTGKAAATIHGRVAAAFGRTTFPPPEELVAAPDVTLRSCGLSAAKTLALKDLAARTLDGTVPSLEALRALDDDAIVQRLTTIRGVGRWTVEMMLMFCLGRPDVLPVDDLGVKKGFGRVYLDGGMPSARELFEHGERWRPYRSVASWFLWRAAERPVRK